MLLLGSAIVLVSVVVAAAVAVWLAYEHSLLRVTDVENDNEHAIRHFRDVLDKAERELLVHDDGDKTVGSLYDDDNTVEAVRQRLRSCPDLKIRCLLNFKADIRMADLRGEYGGRFQVRYLHQRPADDVHFKIADGGKMAYLSIRPQGVTERKGQVIEDIGARERVRKRRALRGAFEFAPQTPCLAENLTHLCRSSPRKRLGGLIDDFNEGFDKAHST